MAAGYVHAALDRVGLTHIRDRIANRLTVHEFSALRPSQLHTIGAVEAKAAAQLCDAVACGMQTVPRLSRILDGGDDAAGRPSTRPAEGSTSAEKENTRTARRQYTARGTTVLTRGTDNRETKRKSRIVVAIRKRPLNLMEEINGNSDVMQADNVSEVVVRESKTKVDLRRYTHVHRFFFDVALNETCSNRDVYDRTARALVDTVFDGGCATCFAYGQTGSGKTHTMLGKGPEPGLYAMAAEDILRRMHTEQVLTVSFYEIYGGKLYDLLNGRKPLRCLEDEKHNVNIRGLTEYVMEDVRDVMHLIESGHKIRSSGSTGANDTSSRSHAILELKLKRRVDEGGVTGKFTFIDLAGSERGADTLDCVRQTRREGAEINKSLLALKECIRFLDQNSKHVPFRGSKLTEVLRDSFVGNCRSLMIGTVSPASSNCEHTLNTLRYADRVKELRKSAADRRPLRENEKIEYEPEPTYQPRSTRASACLPPPGLVPAAENGHGAGALSGRQSAVLTSCTPQLAMSGRGSLGRRRTCGSAVMPCARRKRNRDEPDMRAEKGQCGQSTCPASSLDAQRAHVLSCYEEYLKADMDCIKEEYQIKYDAEQPQHSDRDFVARARALIEVKRRAIGTLSDNLDALEKTMNGDEAEAA